MAQRTTGSPTCRRYRQTSTAVMAARASPHSRMEPARADHSPVTE